MPPVKLQVELLPPGLFTLVEWAMALALVPFCLILGLYLADRTLRAFADLLRGRKRHVRPRP